MELAEDVIHPGAVDVEDRHAPAVDAPDLDAAQLAATDEPEGSQEEVLGLEHRRLPPLVRRGLPEESRLR